MENLRKVGDFCNCEFARVEGGHDHSYPNVVHYRCKMSGRFLGKRASSPIVGEDCLFTKVSELVIKQDKNGKIVIER